MVYCCGPIALDLESRWAVGRRQIACSKWGRKVRKLGGGFKKYIYFHPYLGKISNLTNIFQMGWNHQLGKPNFGRITRRRRLRGNASTCQQISFQTKSLCCFHDPAWGLIRKDVPDRKLGSMVIGSVGDFTPRNTPFISRWNKPLIRTTDPIFLGHPGSECVEGYGSSMAKLQLSNLGRTRDEREREQAVGPSRKLSEDQVLAYLQRWHGSTFSAVYLPIWMVDVYGWVL